MTTAFMFLLLWVGVIGTVSGMYNMHIVRGARDPKPAATEAFVCLNIAAAAVFGAGWLA